MARKGMRAKLMAKKGTDGVDDAMAALNGFDKASKTLMNAMAALSVAMIKDSSRPGQIPDELRGPAYTVSLQARATATWVIRQAHNLLQRAKEAE